MPVSLRTRYGAQKDNARCRGIAFLLTFEEWLQIWEDSGHLYQRGRQRGQYVMSRFGDKGPYAVGNVKIVTTSENIRASEWSEERRARHGLALLGNKNKLGKKESAETRAKKSKAFLGNKNSVGRTYDEAARKRLSIAHRGIRCTPEARKKISEAKRLWWERQRGQT